MSSRQLVQLLQWSDVCWDVQTCNYCGCGFHFISFCLLISFLDSLAPDWWLWLVCKTQILILSIDNCMDGCRFSSQAWCPIVVWKDVGMGVCQYVDLCFLPSSLPCLHTFWHAIPTSFYISNVSNFRVSVLYWCYSHLHLDLRIFFRVHELCVTLPARTWRRANHSLYLPL